MGVEPNYFAKRRTIRKRRFDEILEDPKIQSTNDMFRNDCLFYRNQI